MADAAPVVIQGVLAADDGLQIELSGPMGPTRFTCPDCADDIVFPSPGLIVCQCQSIFRAERLYWRDGRAHHSVRRAAP